MNRRIHILAGLTAIGAAGFALSLWTGRTDAGADKIAFPANYKDGVIYTRWPIVTTSSSTASCMHPPRGHRGGQGGQAPAPRHGALRWCSTRRWWTPRAIR